MDSAEFEKLIAEGFEALPSSIREQVKNVAILLEDEPSPEVRAEEKLEEGETLLGRYVGVPRTARGEGYGVGIPLPDAITLYRIPIEEAAREDILMRGQEPEDGLFKEEVKKVIAETIWHEFAHHFGMDESKVRRREEERKRGK